MFVSFPQLFKDSQVCVAPAAYRLGVQKPNTLCDYQGSVKYAISIFHSHSWFLSTFSMTFSV